MTILEKKKMTSLLLKLADLPSLCWHKPARNISGVRQTDQQEPKTLEQELGFSL